MSLIYVYQSRGIIKDITITNADGSTLTPGANDQVRAIIARRSSNPILTVTSGSPTANGSSFTKNHSAGKNRLRLDAADLAFSPGVYTLFIDYFDNADAQEWKNVDRQVFVLEDT